MVVASPRAPAGERRRRGELERQVRDALVRLHDLPHLAAHPLGQAQRERSATAGAGRRLQRHLIEAVEGLRPTDGSTSGHAARSHRLMELRYVEGWGIPRVCVELGIALSQYHRDHGPALASVAERLAARLADGAPDQEGASGVRRIGAAGSPLVGRDREMALLVEQLKGASSGGGGRLVLIAGEPGVGKTRLADELGERARAEGALFLAGRYGRDGTGTYQAWAELVRAGFVAASEEERPGAEQHNEALAWLCPELVERRRAGRVAPSAARGAPAPELRRRLFDGAVALVLALAAGRPLVLLLDDLQWAPDLALVAHALRRFHDERVLVVATAREQELEAQPALVHTLNDLTRARLVVRLALGALDEAATAQLCAHHLGGDVEPTLATAIHRRTGGNAFFVDQLLRELVARGEAGRRVGAELPMPASVRRLVEERAARLGPGALDALARAAVLHQPFAFPVLLAMTGLTERELLGSVEPALANGVLVDGSTESEERYAFADDHLQEALYGGLAGSRRRRYHRLAAEALEAVYGEHAETHLEELAAHFGAAGDTERAADYEVRAGRKNEALFAWAQALRYYRAGLARYDALGGHLGERAELCERLGTLCHLSGTDIDQSAGYLARALALYEEAGDNERAAAVHATVGFTLLVGAHYAERRMDLAAEHFERARDLLAAGPPSPALAIANARLSFALMSQLDAVGGVQAAERGLAMAKALDDLPALVEAGNAAAGAKSWSGGVAEGLALWDRTWRLIGRHPMPAGRDALALNGVMLAVSLKDPALGLTWAARATQGPRQTVMGRLTMPAYLVGIHALRGDFAAGARLVEELRPTWEALGQPEFTRIASAAGLLLVRRGAWAEARTLLTSAVAWARDARFNFLVTVGEQVLGHLALEEGDAAAAVGHLGTALAVSRDGRHAVTELAALAPLIEAHARLGQLGEAARHLGQARTLLARGDEWGGLAADVELAEARLRAAEGGIAEAERCFAKAEGDYRLRDLAWDAARANEACGEALLGAGDPSAVTRGREKLSAAEAAWRAMEAEPYAARAAALRGLAP